MTNLVLYQDTTLAAQEDFTFHPRLIPGDPMYERLLLQDPKKLKRMIREERQLAADVNTPAYQQRMREHQQRSSARLAEDIASGKFAKRAQDFHSIKQHGSRISIPTPQDRIVLGFDVNTDLTKRSIKNAYRRQARKLHPDVGGNEDDFRHLYTAYRTLLANTKV